MIVIVWVGRKLFLNDADDYMKYALMCGLVPVQSQCLTWIYKYYQKVFVISVLTVL